MATINRELDITENELIEAVFEALRKQGEKGITTIELVVAVGWPITEYYIRKMRRVLNGMDSESVIRCQVRRTYNVGGETLVRGFRLVG